MIGFKYCLEPWDDHGYAIPLTIVAHEIGGEAAIVALHYDLESDTHLYGYWCKGLFAKVFVKEDGGGRGPKVWEADIASLQYEADPTQELSQAQRERSATHIIDALSQWPEGDLRRSRPGTAVRQVLLRRC